MSSEATITFAAVTKNISPSVRNIKLNGNGEKVPIGRASKSISKGLIGNVANAWFDSPVMSREHARVYWDSERQCIMIEDIGAMHGTRLNQQQMTPMKPYSVKTDDMIIFGAEVRRGPDIFPACTFRIICSYPSIKMPENSSNAIQFPYESDLEDDEVYISSDDESYAEYDSNSSNADVRLASSDCIDLTRDASTPQSCSPTGIKSADKIASEHDAVHGQPSSLVINIDDDEEEEEEDRSEGEDDLNEIEISDSMSFKIIDPETSTDAPDLESVTYNFRMPTGVNNGEDIEAGSENYESDQENVSYAEHIAAQNTLEHVLHKAKEAIGDLAEELHTSLAAKTCDGIEAKRVDMEDAARSLCWDSSEDEAKDKGAENKYEDDYEGFEEDPFEKDMACDISQPIALLSKADGQSSPIGREIYPLLQCQQSTCNTASCIDLSTSPALPFGFVRQPSPSDAALPVRKPTYTTVPLPLAQTNPTALKLPIADTKSSEPTSGHRKTAILDTMYANKATLSGLNNEALQEQFDAKAKDLKQYLSTKLQSNDVFEPSRTILTPVGPRSGHSFDHSRLQSTFGSSSKNNGIQTVLQAPKPATKITSESSLAQKRKSDAISDVVEEEVAIWSNEKASANPDIEVTSAIETSVHTIAPAPAVAVVAAPDAPEQPPSKRLKRFAEAAGYAALGAVAAGAGLFSVLVATAPDFV